MYKYNTQYFLFYICVKIKKFLCNNEKTNIGWALFHSFKYIIKASIDLDRQIVKIIFSFNYEKYALCSLFVKIIQYTHKVNISPLRFCAKKKIKQLLIFLQNFSNPIIDNNLLLKEKGSQDEEMLLLIFLSIVFTKKNYSI